MKSGRFLLSIAAQLPWTAAHLVFEKLALAAVVRQREGGSPWGARYECIRAAWLTEALREQGALPPGAVVKSFTLERFGEVGQMSALFRLQLECAGEAEGAARLVLKTTTTEMKNRIFNNSFGVFEREIRSYQLPHPERGLLRPRCWVTQQNPITKAAFLIMEELSAWRGIGAYDKISPADARRLVSALAIHHAQWWQQAELKESGFLTTLETQQQTMGPMCSLAWGRAQKIMTPLVDAEIIGLLADYVKKQECVSKRLMAAPSTLVHGDLNTNNIFFDDAGDRVCAIDWQSTRIGNWAEDLAYANLMCLETEDYLAHEAGLMELHRQILAQQGIVVKEADYRECYRLGVLQVAAMLIVAAMVIDPDKDPALYERYRSTISGWATVAKRHQLQDLLNTLSP